MSSPITANRLVYDVPFINDAQISPDGSRVAWVHVQNSRESNAPESQIWIANTDGSNARQLTQVGTANSQPVWSPDSASFAYVSHRDGDKPNAIVILGFEGGEGRVLTTHDTSPGSLAWSPDGKTIAYVKAVDPENPNETPRDPKAPPAVRIVARIDYKQDGYGFVNNIRSQIFLLDLASGESRQLTSESMDHVSPQWSPDGDTLAVVLPNNNGMRTKLGLIDVASGKVATYGNDDGTVGVPSWSPDGARIIFTGQQFASSHPDLTFFNVATGSFQTLLDNPDFLLNGAASAVWLDGATILVPGLFHGRSGLWTVDTSSSATTEIGSWNAEHEGLSVDDAGTTIVQTATSLEGFVGVVAIDRTSGKHTTVVDAGAIVFTETPVAQWELISLERAGFTVEGLLLKPTDFDPAQKYPLILEIHGGPNWLHSYRLNDVAQNFATNGFFVLLANPRGSTSYGRDFTEAVTGDWGGEDWNDLQAMTDLVLERPYIDKERTGISGYSYGGFMTSWALGHTDRFKAAIVGAPCFDLESFFGTSDIGHLFGPSQTGGLPWENRERMAAQSPSTFIHNAVTPTLIVHGEADERCPIGQGEQLFISLKKLGIETEFVRYPGGSHIFVFNGAPALRLDFLTRTLAWFKKHLGDPA